jgi:hypothetical protein
VVANLLFIIPIILSGIIFIYLLTSHVEIQSHFYDICRTDLAQTQSITSQELALIMALNPLITTTEWISIALKIATIFSYANPALGALLQGLLKGTESIENAILKMQQTLIRIMEHTMTLGLFFTKAHLQTTFYNYKWKLSNLTSLNNLTLDFSNKTKPAIEPTNKNKKLSTYRVKSDFIREQRLYLKWVYNSKIQSKFSTYAILNKSFKGKCIFSLEENDPWKTIQIAAR